MVADALSGSLTEAQAGQDARILQRALKQLHPALTKYLSQAAMDAAFGRFDARAQNARTAAEMYPAALITPVGGRWLILSSADPAIAVGDEILAINGMAGKDIVSRMLPYLRADGSSDGKRLRQLSHDRSCYSQVDIVRPLLSPPIDGRQSFDW